MNIFYELITDAGYGIDIASSTGGVSKLYLTLNGSRIAMEPLLFRNNKKPSSFLMEKAPKSHRTSHLSQAMYLALKQVKAMPEVVTMDELKNREKKDASNKTSVYKQIREKLATLDTSTMTVEELAEETGASKKQLWYLLSRHNIKFIKQKTGSKRKLFF